MAANFPCMRPFFKIPVAVHRILPTLDVSDAHPLALLSLFKRSSNAYQTLFKRSSIALLGSSWLFFFRLLLSIPLGRSSIAHLSLICGATASPARCLIQP
jgi:hypothetical protein